MNKVKIITDTCSDLTTELLDRYNIDYARMSTIEDEVESPALLNWTDADAHAFFEKMRNGKRITTSQAPATEFERIFPFYLEQGYDIIYIACSSKQSSSVNTGSVMAEKLLQSYPNQKIYCIDSLNASAGEGMLAIEAAKMAAQGKGVDEINESILAMRNNVREYVTVHTLEYLKKAGRVSASSAFFGNLMGIKPILVSDANGAQAAMKKVKGRQNSIKEIVNLTKESITNPEEQTVYVVHADAAKEDVDALVSLVKQEIPCKEVVVLGIGPIIGASIGPDALGVFSFGSEVTFVGESD